ncbi:MAG: type II toxin-antitoxin system antitoxin SocA domain-containing protein [Candidatus Marinarcus sp.]|uniref:type II toxin-antitoxin system antitoxin SocA domain-containing protein n=1 Tax=Candidatus Marinarcus sp. TaxID=3100987 RepID=UPI003B002CAD
MQTDMTKIANVILYMLHKQVKHLNDKKLSIMLFLMDYNHTKYCGKKIFADEYIKNARNPEPKMLSEIFDIIANEEDLDEEDERLYLIQELLDFLDIEVEVKEKFIELRFLKMEEEYDESIFTKDELKTIYKVVADYHDMSVRNIANACFKLDEVRKTALGEKIL